MSIESQVELKEISCLWAQTWKAGSDIRVYGQVSNSSGAWERLTFLSNCVNLFTVTRIVCINLRKKHFDLLGLIIISNL